MAAGGGSGGDAVRPRLSVVIVSYRSREPLGRCLESLERCRADLMLETIVVDNASGDGTVEWVAHAHPWVGTIANRANEGFTRGVNRGVARARGDAVLVLNPDCEVMPGALETLLEALEDDPALAAVAPALPGDDGVKARSCGRFPSLWWLACDHLGLASAFPRTALFGGYKYGERPMEALGEVSWASGAALLIPARVWQEVGGLDEAIFMYMEEVDWCRRAAARGLKVRYVPGAVIRHAGGQSSRQVPGETYLHNLRSRVYYFRKHQGPGAALAAKLILAASLALKWAVSRSAHSRRVVARVYAAGLAAVWAA
jgi:GT2 family glycosyltransferase